VKSGDTDQTIVGRIAGVFGIKGWVKITSFTEPSENLFDYSPWRVKMREGWQEIKVDQTQRHNSKILQLIESSLLN